MSYPVRFLCLVPLFLALVLSGCQEPGEEGAGADTEGQMAEEDTPGTQMQGEQDMQKMEMVPDSLQRMKLAPLVKGYYEGGELYFIHTEASDEKVAKMLTEMMGPRVVLLPQLAETPESLLAEIYVFENGVEGMGPFGYQPDVFGSVPSEESYSPFQAVHLVSWNENATPRELRSVKEIKEAASQGELSIEETDIVINAPVLAWPGGHR